MARALDKPKVSMKEKIHGIGENNLTIKQRKFVKAIAISGNATQAVKQAGYNVKNDQTAGAIGSKLLKKAKVQESLAEILDNVGLTEERATELLSEAIVSGVGRDSRNSDALRGLDMLFKVRGSYAPKKVESIGLSIKYDANNSESLKEMLQKQADTIKKLQEHISE